jgi:hypothetical protein
MSFYENQSDMFNTRATNCKKNGDRLYAQAMTAKELGNGERHQECLAQAMTQYKMQKENELKAAEHSEKTWRQPL